MGHITKEIWKLRLDGILTSFISAITFSYSWNFIAPTYFKFLPSVWLNITPLETICFIFIILFFGRYINILIPKFKG